MQPAQIPQAGTLTSEDAANLRDANEQLVFTTLRAQAAESALHEASRHKDEFLAMLGHELRNPLVPIRNAAAVLHQIDGADPRISWVHDVLVRQVGHLTRLMDDLLHVSLIARGQIQLHRESVDFCAVLSYALNNMEDAMKRRGHDMVARMPERPVWVDGDAIRLTQVIENLLTNAGKYTEDHGRIDVSLTTENDTATLRVGDNGLGISAELLPRVFDLYAQDVRVTDRFQGGLGIGLALVRHLVELHRGSVEARSAGPLQGSEFVVRLPMLEQHEAGGPSKETPPSNGAGRVLVVDDDPESGESMAMLLGLFGYDVRSVVNLKTALLEARMFRPTVVVMDIAMPGVDGYQIARQMRGLEETRDAVYIGLSGYGRPDDFRRSLEAGFVEHLVKPVEPTTLDALLQRVLRQTIQR